MNDNVLYHSLYRDRKSRQEVLGATPLCNGAKVASPNTYAQIQLISGHESKKSLEVYQHLSLESVDKAYQDAVQSVGI